MRGNGQSERVESIGPADWVDDVAALMDHSNRCIVRISSRPKRRIVAATRPCTVSWLVTSA
jgi:hypothetical protein